MDKNGQGINSSDQDTEDEFDFCEVSSDQIDMKIVMKKMKKLETEMAEMKKKENGTENQISYVEKEGKIHHNNQIVHSNFLMGWTKGEPSMCIKGWKKNEKFGELKAKNGLTNKSKEICKFEGEENEERNKMELMSELVKKDKELDDMKKENGKMEEQMAEMMKALARMMKESNEWKEKCGKLDEKSAKKDDKMEEMKKVIEGLKVENDEKNRAFEELKEENGKKLKEQLVGKGRALKENANEKEMVDELKIGGMDSADDDDALQGQIFSIYNKLREMKQANEKWKQKKGKDEEKFARMNGGLNEYQINKLENTFDSYKYLCTNQKIQLANELAITGGRVKKWFRHRRQKWIQCGNTEMLKCNMEYELNAFIKDWTDQILRK